ncbi:MAG: septum formation initiator family protein [Firmicutes bacterium]|nr:septum formation initiator family protein [Bacillota bacterium]
MLRGRRARFRIRPRFFLAMGVLFLAGYVVYSYVEGFLQLRVLRAEVRQVREQIEALEAENARLRAELERYNSDPFIERVAREELGLVRPGETPVLVVDPP